MEENTKSTKKPNFKLEFNPLLESEQKLIEVEDRYIATANSERVNSLALIGKRPKNLNIDTISNKATLEINGTEIEYTDTNPREYLGVKNGVIFDYVTTNLIAQNSYNDLKKINHRVTFSLEDYAKDFGRSYTETTWNNTKKNIRRELAKAFNSLQNTKIKLKGENYQGSSTVFCSDFIIGKDSVAFEFPVRLSEHLIKSPLSYIPRKIFTISGKNSNIYPIARKLSEHYHIYNNRNRDTHNILSVKTLLKVAPEIPSYEEVMKGNRDWRGRIVGALEKNLDLLEKEGVISWEWCNTKKTPLTDKQLEIPNYNTFENFYITFEMLGASKNDKQLKEWKKKREQKPKPKKKNK